jgi:hypothetical protein
LRRATVLLAALGLVLAACGGSEPAPGAGLPFLDPGDSEDVSAVWGEYACADADRLGVVREGGVDGGAYRRFTVVDGDDVDGERCEAGRNDHTDGPTAVFREGERLTTSFAVRLPEDFPLDSERFQVVMQMKQSQPAANGDGTPVLALEARDGRWLLMQSTSSGPSSDTRELWSARARPGVWARFEFDVTYSAEPGEGRIRVRGDLNGDGELEADSGELSAFTLKEETEGGEEGDGIEPGEAIPSHLRIGLYHDPKVPCPPPRGCSVEFDDVRIEASG